MLRVLLAALVVAPVVLAAPVPKEDDAARMVRIFGTRDDPDKDCTFEMAGDRLRVKIPAKHHSLSQRFQNAPRVWREVAGDFTAVVRVTFPVRPAADLEADEFSVPYATAGLVAWASDEGYCQVLREERVLNGESREAFERLLWVRKTPKAAVGGISPAGQKPPDAAFLRLARDGKTLKSAHSRDGKGWTEHGAVEVGWGAVKVGVMAENGYKAPFEVTFDEYTLTVPKK
ncbi:MAG: hypothetical protein C0501_00245 [Isosphaera sp.]|nr:hypothetical protein [Isosphaera sp.]